MDSLKFVIESSEAQKMVKTQGLNSVLQLLPFIARSAQKLARPPISGFSVAAVGLASDGRIFIGVNVEFPGLPLHHSIHAEQFLIANLFRHPKITLENVVVSAYPCGHCRQFLQEIRGASDIQIFILPTHDHEHEHEHEHEHGNGNFWFKSACSLSIAENFQNCFKPLSYYLPHRFGPDDLLEKDVPLILETHENKLILVNELINKGQNGNLTNGNSTYFDLKNAVLGALDAANKSHAPYSKCPSGITLVDKIGNIYKGSYMESAAYNPSLGPAQAAVIDFIAASAGRTETGFGDIVGAVLVEKEGAVVRQKETVKLFVMAVFPKCEFHVYYCKDSCSDLKGNTGN